MGILSYFLLNKCAYQFSWTDMGGPCLMLERFLERFLEV